MLPYVAGRLLQAIIAVFGVLTIVFIVMRFSGDPTLLLVPEGASPESIDALRTELGFDRPVIVQYIDYLRLSRILTLECPSSSASRPSTSSPRAFLTP